MIIKRNLGIIILLDYSFSTEGWGDGLMDKRLALQMLRLEFGSPAHYIVSQAFELHIISTLWRLRQGKDSPGQMFLLSSPELQRSEFNKYYILMNKLKSDKRTHPTSISEFHIHAFTHVCVTTQNINIHPLVYTIHVSKHTCSNTLQKWRERSKTAASQREVLFLQLAV